MATNTSKPGSNPFFSLKPALAILIPANTLIAQLLFICTL
jgi:hypothetical protein